MSTETSKRFSNREVYEKVTAKIVAALESGVVPWVKPFVSAGLPCNAVSRRAYSGVNALVTYFEAIQKGYSTQGWVTFKQALSLGLVVRKGEKSTPVVFMAKVNVKNRDKTTSTDPDKRAVFLARMFYVFNLDQLAELEGNEGALEHAKGRMAPRFEHSPIEDCEAAIKATGARIVRHGAAAYSPSSDVVMMPEPEAFKSVPMYYATMFHELGHWTGHETRLAREFGKRFGDHAYACEELVAELTAAFLSHRFGFDVVSQSAAYLQNWLDAIKADPSALVAAATAASAAAELIAPSVVSVADDETSEDESEERRAA